MPQIAMIQPATAKAPPPTSPTAETGAERFSPHLQNEISKRTTQTSSNSENFVKTPRQKADTGNLEETTQLLDINCEEENSSSGSDSMFFIMNQTWIESQTVITTTPDNGQYSTDLSSLFHFLTNFTREGGENTGELSPSSQISTFNFATDTTSGSEKNIFMNFTSVEASSVTLAVQSTEQQPESNALLLELQKIIANSNETGTAAINISNTTLKGQASLENLQAPLVAMEREPLAAVSVSNVKNDFDAGGETLIMPGSEIHVEKSNQNLTSTRNSIQQQYYDGRIAPENDQENQSTLENGQQENTFTPKTTTGVEGNMSAASNQEQPNTFAQPLVSAQEAQKTQTTESLRPVTLPSGTVVHQEEVIRHIAERFQISHRDSNTRINIQLHPAELGELRIDLSVKNGTVRANVVASTQISQDIIEKNMPKLRSILENQGLIIDEILVSNTSPAVEDFNLFDQQLFGHNDYTPSSRQQGGNQTAIFTLDGVVPAQESSTLGVNVKI